MNSKEQANRISQLEEQVRELNSWCASIIDGCAQMKKQLDRMERKQNETTKFNPQIKRVN